jgi:glycine cleavage system aminomethyltransferase T
VELRHTGLKALASLRMEKGYRDYGHDIDNTDSVLEAGLGFAVALDKPGGFVGRDAVLAKKAAGPLTRRLVQVRVVDPEPLMHHGEIVLRAGEAATSGRPATGTRWAARWAWRWSSAPMESLPTS